MNMQRPTNLNEWRAKKQIESPSIPLNGALDPEHKATAESAYFEDLDEADFSPELWEVAARFATEYPEASQDVADRLIDAQMLIGLSSIKDSIDALSASYESLEKLMAELPAIDPEALTNPQVTVLGRTSVHLATPNLAQPAKLLQFPPKKQ